MYLSITKIHLKNPGQIFLFFRHVRGISKQLQQSKCKRHRLKGGFMKHYTMTLWYSKEDLHEFVRSGAHGNSMKDINKVARSFTTLTIDAYNLIPWREAMAMLEKEEKRRSAANKGK
ncbi:MAG: DUF3291 domain-containing protein [Flavobacteriia bacterium]|nr:DUF3291 domain-containing protein [Flavobacteriia bacterium]